MDYQTPDEVVALIDAAGGPSALAKRLGWPAEGGRQRVNAWKAAGKVPKMVALAYRSLFKRIISQAEKTSE